MKSFSMQRTGILLSFLFWLAALASSQAEVGLRIVESARKQLGVTTIYDPAYVALTYPNGDVSQERGVCTDVIIRALRDALGLDLQKVVHEDMRSHFSMYPKNWGLKSTDRNIDHRRVPNLQTYFKRHHVTFKVSEDPRTYKPGDFVTSMLPGNLPHIMIVSDKQTDSGTPLVIHNIGAGTKEEDGLFRFPLTGHYRLKSVP